MIPILSTGFPMSLRTSTSQQASTAALWFGREQQQVNKYVGRFCNEEFLLAVENLMLTSC